MELLVGYLDAQQADGKFLPANVAYEFLHNLLNSEDLWKGERNDDVPNNELRS